VRQRVWYDLKKLKMRFDAVANEILNRSTFLILWRQHELGQAPRELGEISQLTGGHIVSSRGFFVSATNSWVEFSYLPEFSDCGVVSPFDSF
jgi:hypothetical protein